MQTSSKRTKKKSDSFYFFCHIRQVSLKRALTNIIDPQEPDSQQGILLFWQRGPGG
jgi:hypothetical protein